MQVGKWVTLGFGAFCLVAVAGVVQQSHLYYMAAILLTLPGMSYALGWYALRGLAFRREVPPVAWEGEEGQIVYAAINTTALPRYFLSVTEAMPSWIRPLELEPPLFNAAANDTVRIAHKVQFLKRGVYRVDGFDVTAIDPLGVFSFTKHFPTEGEIVVYPLPQALQQTTLTGSERYGWQEFTALALRGNSVDPDGVRPYTPGDPLRRIHWRQTARTGRLSVIEFEEAQSINLAIALDTHKNSNVGTGTETTLEYGVRFAASMAQQAIQQGAGLRLLVAPGKNEQDNFQYERAAVSGHSDEQLYAVLDALARVEAEADATAAELLEAAYGLASASSLLVITARNDRSLPEVLARHSANGVHVLLVYLDPDSFRDGRDQSAETRRFLTDLIAVGVQPFVLCKNEKGALLPEAVQYGNFAAV